MANTTIPSELLADGSVATAKIADDAVTSAKLDTNIAIGGTLDVTGDITTGSLTTTGDINIPKEKKAVFGDIAAKYLMIWHNGYSGGIRQSYPDSFTIFSHFLFLKNPNGSKTLAKFETDDAVTLYYDNSAKLATTSTGIDVTGTATMDGLTVDGSVDINSGVLDLDAGYAIRWGGTASGIYSGSGAADMVFTAGSSERFRVNGSSGNVGIGTNNPTRQLSIYGTNDGYMSFNGGRAGNHEYVVGTDSSGFIIYDETLDAYRLVIDQDSGNVGIGTSSGTAQFNVTYAYPKDGAKWTTNSNSTHTAISFNTPSGNAGTINTNTLSTSYNTSSDYRLKENVEYDWDATTRLKQLKPSRFNFIADADTTVDGFLAHEVQDIVPEAISGEKDAVDADGNPKYQGIDQSKLVPLLTKALQEQQTLIESLTARITTLEG